MAKKRRTLALDGYRPPKGVKSFYRDSGGWYVIITDETRQPKSRWVKLNTHADPIAAARFVEKAQAYDLGQYDPWRDSGHRISLEDAVGEFLKADPTLRRSTRNEREYTLNLLSESVKGATLDRITSRDVERFIYDRQGERADPETGEVTFYDLADSTRAGYYARIRTFFKWCVKAGHLRDDPTDAVPKPKPPKRLPAFLSPEDLERLIATIEADARLRSHTMADGAVVWLVDVVTFAVNTGLRLGELCALRWRDVILVSEEVAADPETAVFGSIAVRNHVTADGKAFKTKTGRERRIPMTRAAWEILRRLGERRPNEDDKRTVFVGLNGKALYPNFVSRTFRAYRKMAKLPETIRFHSLRHTCASWMASRGVPLRVIQDVLGHTSIKSTEIYAHLLPGASDAMVAAFDELRKQDPEGAKRVEEIPKEKLLEALRELINA